nr:MAG TPA: hypothetical protein [Caudoviricetes sp.]
MFANNAFYHLRYMHIRIIVSLIRGHLRILR